MTRSHTKFYEKCPGGSQIVGGGGGRSGHRTVVRNSAGGLWIVKMSGDEFFCVSTSI
jgi:hypothetical protein